MTFAGDCSVIMLSSINSSSAFYSVELFLHIMCDVSKY